MQCTWAPAGQTPALHVVKGSQTKLSVAALCCYRPGQQPRMLYRSRPGWYHDRDLITLLDAAHQELAAPILLVWDNLSAHRSHRMRRHRRPGLVGGGVPGAPTRPS
ncbi:hypothetical protein [Thermobifida halotolerans]|uniref:hypothetical protein n=1 Tax=Thermobifida halotolerans TaxID=483545 RepID=UPI000A54745B|nr:hypothetical protein [Thermobifida halotolerans]